MRRLRTSDIAAGSSAWRSLQAGAGRGARRVVPGDMKTEYMSKYSYVKLPCQLTRLLA
jgi:hypothetical protein